MKIKIFVVVLAAFAMGCLSLSAQTPEEIVKKMTAEIQAAETGGYAVDLNMKMPIIGLVKSHIMVYGDKTRMDVSGKEKMGTVWTDATTKWDYSPKDATVTITNKEGSDSGQNELQSVKGLDEGYKLTLKEETADSWYIICKKTKANKVKEDPKKVYLTVSKATYLPISMLSKSMLFTVNMANMATGVTEADVTFDPASLPGVNIIDKR